MDNIEHVLKLDFSQNKVLDTINVKQFEQNTRDILLYLYYNGQPITLNPSVDTATINASVNGTVTTFDENCEVYARYVSVPLYASLATLPGDELCEVKISRSTDGTEYVIYTATFHINVEPSTATSLTPQVLSTTELAATITSLDNRMTALEGGSSLDDVLTSIGTAKTSIEANTDAVEDAIMTKLGNPQTASLESQISSLSGNIDTAKTSIESNTDSARTYLYNSLNTAKNEILAEIESKNNAVKADLLSEMDLKYYDMTNKLSQMKREILKAISTLSDEATGNGTVASHSILITNGFISDSYGFRIPTEG